MTGGGSRVSIVAGLCARHDAITNSVLLQASVLSDAGYDVQILAQHADVRELPEVRVVPDPWQLQMDAHYRTSELVVFHYGIHYGLFDALLLPHELARRVVHFHNVTPPHLLDGVTRVQAQRGLEQIAIASGADVVWCDLEVQRGDPPGVR